MADYTKHIWASGELITSTLLNHIEDQLALTAPAAATIAAVYDNQKYYLKDEYCLYDGQLWRALAPTNAHIPAEGTYWTTATVGKDLNKIFSGVDVLEKIQPLIYSGHIRSGYIDTSTNGIWHDSTSFYHVMLPVNSGTSIYVQSNNSYQAIIAGLTAKDTPIEGELASFSTQIGWTLTNTIATGDSYTGRIPDDVKYLYVYLGSSSYPRMPLSLIIDGYDYAKDLYDNFIEIKHNVDSVINNTTTKYAEKLIESNGIENNAAFAMRMAKNSLQNEELARREIIGGTVVWNQLVTDPNFEDSSKWVKIATNYETLSFSDNIVTMTVTTANSALGIANRNSSVPSLTGHKILFSVYINPDKQVTSRFGGASAAAGKYNTEAFSVDASVWTHIEQIGECQSGNTATTLNLYLNTSNTLAVNDTVKVKKFICIDLSTMFGAEVADYIYSLETATAGAGIAKLKSWGFFLNDYYAYDTGSFKSVKVEGIESMGFNQWDEEWEAGGIHTDTGANQSYSNSIRSKNYIPILPNELYYMKAPANLFPFFYDADKNYIGFFGNGWKNLERVPANLTNSLSGGASFANARYMRFRCDCGSTYANNINLNFSVTSRNGEYEQYIKQTYSLDSNLELHGIPKLDSNNNLYYDGDSYESSGKVTRKYRFLHLGDETWTRTSVSINDETVYFFYPPTFQTKAENANFIIPGYVNKGLGRTYLTEDKTCSTYNASSYIKRIAIRDDTYSDADSFKAAMNGVYLLYESTVTDIEYASPYTNPQYAGIFGSERFIDSRAVAMPVGCNTIYPYKNQELAEYDDRINSLYGYVNYGYKDEELAGGNNLVSVKRRGTRYILDGKNGATTANYIKISNQLMNVKTAATGANTFSNPITLLNGHTYVFKIRRISGTWSATDPGNYTIPAIFIYHAGVNAGEGSVIYKDSNTYIKTFTGDGTDYHIILYIPSTSTLDNFTCEVTVEDTTQDSAMVYTETITDSDVTLTALPNRRYLCGEVSTLALTPCANGIFNIRFTSGSSVTLLTVPDTVKWANNFDPSALESDTIYELSIEDGIYGVASKWT